MAGKISGSQAHTVSNCVDKELGIACFGNGRGSCGLQGAAQGSVITLTAVLSLHLRCYRKSNAIFSCEGLLSSLAWLGLHSGTALIVHTRGNVGFEARSYSKISCSLDCFKSKSVVPQLKMATPPHAHRSCPGETARDPTSRAISWLSPSYKLIIDLINASFRRRPTAECTI